MFNKLIHFFQYHNAVPIIFSLISIASVSALAASPEVRDNFLSSEETIQSVDNSGILAANLDNFNFGLKITIIQEDNNYYYISYNYQSMAVVDYFWQQVQKENILKVSKEGLAGRDLGLYVADQLGEVINYELLYLQEVKKNEQEKGLTKKVATIEYAGLIGQFFDSKEKVFPGYQPIVVQDPATTAVVAFEIIPNSGNATGTKGGMVSKAYIKDLVMEILAQNQGQDYQSSQEQENDDIVTPIIPAGEVAGAETTIEDPSTSTEAEIENSENPTTTEPVIEDTISEDSETEEPVIEEPVIEEPIIEEPAEEQPVDENPPAQAEEPAAETPAE